MSSDETAALERVPPIMRVMSIPFVALGAVALLLLWSLEPPAVAAELEYYDLYAVSYDGLFLLGVGALAIGCLNTLYIGYEWWWATDTLTGDGIDEVTDFDAAASNTVVIRVNGREYEFRAEDVPALKARFEDLEIHDHTDQ